jgi:hypothetical protein
MNEFRTEKWHKIADSRRAITGGVRAPACKRSVAVVSCRIRVCGEMGGRQRAPPGGR